MFAFYTAQVTGWTQSKCGDPGGQQEVLGDEITMENTDSVTSEFFSYAVEA